MVSESGISVVSEAGVQFWFLNLVFFSEACFFLMSCHLCIERGMGRRGKEQQEKGGVEEAPDPECQVSLGLGRFFCAP